jgi:hypothetical protein
MTQSIRDLPITHGEAQRLRAPRQAPLDNVVDMVSPVARSVTRRRRRFGEWLAVNHRRLREIAAATIGVVAPIVAAFEWHPWLGLIATGVGALLWERLAFGVDETPGNHRAGEQ